MKNKTLKNVMKAVRALLRGVPDEMKHYHIEVAGELDDEGTQLSVLLSPYDENYLCTVSITTRSKQLYSFTTTVPFALEDEEQIQHIVGMVLVMYKLGKSPYRDTSSEEAETPEEEKVEETEGKVEESILSAEAQEGKRWVVALEEE